MCLDAVTNYTPEPEGYAYKVFLTIPNTKNLRAAVLENYTFETNVLHLSICSRLQSASCDDQIYELGFHSYKSEKDAMLAKDYLTTNYPPMHKCSEYVVRRVWYEGAIVEGTQEGKRVIVSKKVKICV